MKSLTKEEAKTVLLEVLEAIHQYCSKHKLSYALCGGALIGAIRHGGFIPWDDDIDIIMPRNDYEVLMKDFNSENDRYILHCLRNDKEYNLPFAKIEDTHTILVEKSNSGKEMGISVDIFPADLMGLDIDSSRKIVSKLKIIKTLYKGKLVRPNKRNSIVKIIGMYSVKLFCFPISLRRLAEIIEKKCLHAGIEDAKYMGCLCWGYGEKEIMPCELFDEYTTICFEGKSFMTFNMYDYYLKKIYGDYMQLPPIEKRCSPHEISGIYMK